MIHKLHSPKADCVRVVFELPACLWADRIFLVGDFNEWSKSITPFAQGRDGIWQAIVDLPAGREYQFRYLVDDHWQTDYHADGWVQNEFGSQNSIVHAVLPPETGPMLGLSSLLHEGNREPGGFRSLALPSQPRFSPPTSTVKRFSPPPRRAAG